MELQVTGVWLTDDMARMLIAQMRENIELAERGDDLGFGGIEPMQALRNNVDWLERKWHEQVGENSEFVKLAPQTP